MWERLYRHYKLTKKSTWDLWMSGLRGELAARLLLDVIDETMPPLKRFEEVQTQARKQIVSDIIRSRIDDEYV